jgi:hypothetical protein
MLLDYGDEMAAVEVLSRSNEAEEIAEGMASTENGIVFNDS